MRKEELLRKVGSLQQAAYVRPVEYQEGRAKGLRAYEVMNGPLRYHVLADKCLDMGELQYKGVNFSFLSKPGLQGRNHYDTRGQEALRSIMGGMFFTAGLENICAPCTVEGKDYPMHGRIRTTPGEDLSGSVRWIQDSCYLTVSGTFREAELFGENLVLRRTVESRYGEPSVVITDEIENQSFRREPMMILYHINIGYPLLDEGTEILLATRSVTPRDQAARGHEDRWNVMDAPKDNEPEYVFLHDPIPRKDGAVIAAAVNETLGLGLRIEYTSQNLPYFMEWKSTASGDYVIGLEPSNSSVYGRPYHEARKDLHYMEPFAKETNVLTFTVLDGAAEIQAVREEIRALGGETRKS